MGSLYTSALPALAAVASPSPGMLQSTFLRSATPDVAVAVASLGVCLIFVELNRPGRILPGALGLSLLLLAAGNLLAGGVRPWAAFLLLSCIAIMLLHVWRRLTTTLLMLTGLASIVSLRFLEPPYRNPPVHTPVAILCGGVLASLSAFLARVAYRARRAKALD